MPDSSDYMASQPSISRESGITAVIRQRPAPITSIVCDSLNGVSDKLRTVFSFAVSNDSCTLLTVFPDIRPAVLLRPGFPHPVRDKLALVLGEHQPHMHEPRLGALSAVLPTLGLTERLG